MRSALFGLLIFVLLGASGWAQQPTSSPQATAPTPAPQDSQAVSVLNQALTVAGGTSAIRAIQDYTATGNISYPSQQDAQGTVTVLGMNGTEFRMDANLPAGTRTWAVAGGVITTKNEKGTIWSMAPKGPVPSSDAFPYQTPLFPASIAFPTRQLAALVGNPSYSLSYKGVSQVDGHSVHDIQFQRGSSAVANTGSFTLPPRTRDIFIDTGTFQIIKVSDTLPKGIPHELHYSNYQAATGILMPFSISEDIGGQQSWTVQFNQFTFNTSLQEASFTIQ
jgi:hypothetical protein